MAQRNKPKILIFEDDDFAVDIYATKFADSGFEVKVFLDYKNVVERAIAEKPDTICCDIMMPTTNEGYEAIKTLVSDKRTKDIPIIVLTNLDKDIDKARHFEGRIVGYFVKTDYTPSELVESVKDHLFKMGKFTENDFSDGVKV